MTQLLRSAQQLSVQDGFAQEQVYSNCLRILNERQQAMREASVNAAKDQADAGYAISGRGRGRGRGDDDGRDCGHARVRNVHCYDCDRDHDDGAHGRVHMDQSCARHHRVRDLVS